MADPGADGGLTERVERVLAPTFDLDREIGRGGMGIVYRATDRRLKRAVAVKVLPPDLAYRADIRSRFLHEAETAAQLSHPNIVPIFTVDERDGLVYFVMAYVDGQTLAHYLRAVGGALPIGESLRILREVAAALAYAHAHGVIHRDIKPDNILLAADGARVMVTDFGIARAVTATGDSRLTATGVAIGTPAYMSPEQCAGDREVDGRSDLYSLGVVAYQMLCGSLPFTGSSTAAVLVKQISESPVALAQRCPALPAGLAAAIMRLLAKDPGDRFPDAAAFLAAISDRAIHTPSPAPAPASGTGRPVPPPVAMPPGVPVPPPIRDFGPGRPGSPATEAERLAAVMDVFKSRREQRDIARAIRRGEVVDADPLARRIRRFRGLVVSMGGSMAFVTAVNLITSPHAFWAVWPILGMSTVVVQAAGRLWADGISPFRAFGSRAREQLSRATMAPPPAARLSGADAAAVAAAGLAPLSVLAGPFGPLVRRAALDRDRIRDLVSQLSARDLALVPNAGATADALADQVGSLAAALHNIDVETPEAQRAALAGRRGTLQEQMERASLLLQTLYLDLLRLRMSDASSGADGVVSVTEQATSLSRDIGYLLGAADELRKL